MAYQALYRKYRPTSFDEVVGQKHIVQTLKNAIQLDRIGHAYLFCGPRGTGKTSIAKIFAKMLNCEVSPMHPCGHCTSCQLIQNGSHPDIIEIDAASNNGVDEVRNLIDKVQYAPLQGKYKVYIIDEVHMMTTGAFNALLKTIEEPPAHVIFILATTEPYKVLPTIISRCQKFDFSNVSRSDIVQKLKEICEKENVDAEPEAIELISSLAQGGMRDSLSILDQCIAYSPEHLRLENVRDIYGLVTQEEIGIIFSLLFEKDTDALMEKIESISESGLDLKRFTSDFIHLLKDSIILDYSPNSLLVSDEDSAILEKYFMNSPTQFRLTLLNELMDVFSKFRYASSISDYIESSLLKMIYYSYDLENSQKQDNKSISIQRSDPIPFSEIPKLSSDFRTEKSEISKREPNVPKNNETIPPEKISDVSRETLSTDIQSDMQFILEDDFVISLLAGGNKSIRESDSEKFKNILNYSSNITFGKFVATLRNAKLVASSSNYLVIEVSNPVIAKRINELEAKQGYQELMEKVLGTEKKIFGIDVNQRKRVIQKFRYLAKIKSLPQPAQIYLEKKEAMAKEELSDEERIKEIFPDLEIIND